jgi:hypothetical protein
LLSNPLAKLAIGAIPILVVVVLYQLLALERDRPRIFPQVGEIWNAIAEGPVARGDEVVVEAIDGMVLRVRKV